jgi:hypothetical protein
VQDLFDKLEINTARLQLAAPTTVTVEEEDAVASPNCPIEVPVVLTKIIKTSPKPRKYASVVKFSHTMHKG